MFNILRFLAITAFIVITYISITNKQYFATYIYIGNIFFFLYVTTITKQIIMAIAIVKLEKTNESLAFIILVLSHVLLWPYFWYRLYVNGKKLNKENRT